MRIPALVLSIFVVAATSASADSVFSSDFEQGDVCGWSATAGACWSGDAMAQSLVQLGTYAVCVPPTTVTYVVPVLGTLSVELCGQSQCASGAPGCDATAHVTSATYDAQTGRADLTGSLDDAVFPVQVNFLGTTEDDSLSVSAADGTGTIDDQELPTCFSDIWQVSDVPGAQAGPRRDARLQRRSARHLCQHLPELLPGPHPVADRRLGGRVHPRAGRVPLRRPLGLSAQLSGELAYRAPSTR